MVSCIPTKFGDCTFVKIVIKISDNVIKSHVTQWLHAVSSFLPKLVYMSFVKLII